MQTLRLTKCVAVLLCAASINSAKADPGFPVVRAYEEQRSVILPPLAFAGSCTGDVTRSASGEFLPAERDWVYLPVDVPSGVREIAVSYDYDRPTPPAGERNNALDIGIFRRVLLRARQ